MTRFTIILLAGAMALTSCATSSVSVETTEDLLVHLVARVDAAGLAPAHQDAFDAAVAEVRSYGLAGEERIPASAMPSIEMIVGVHKAVVEADTSLSESKRAHYLRSGDLLLRMFTEASAPVQ